MKRWMALSLLIPKALIEPISNFLMEEGASGIEEVDEGPDQTKLKSYFPRDGKEKTALCALRRYLRSLGAIYPEMSHIQIEPMSVVEQDWGRNWRRFFKPVRIGSRFIVKPPWSKIRCNPGDLSIEINPGMAFGTGTHATTQLCMEALEKRIRGGGDTVLDVGTGSGILSIAAAKLGALEVWGIDLDSMAVEMAREGVARNQVLERVRIKRGSLGDIRKRFDLIVANIDFKTLRRARRAMICHLKEEGCLILSGILEKEEEALRRYYVETGEVRWVETTRQREWVCLTFLKK